VPPQHKMVRASAPATAQSARNYPRIGTSSRRSWMLREAFRFLHFVVRVARPKVPTPSVPEKVRQTCPNSLGNKVICFVSGHDFSRAAPAQNGKGFSPCYRTIRTKLPANRHIFQAKLDPERGISIPALCRARCKAQSANPVCPGKG